MRNLRYPVRLHSPTWSARCSGYCPALAHAWRLSRGQQIKPSTSSRPISKETCSCIFQGHFPAVWKNCCEGEMSGFEEHRGKNRITWEIVMYAFFFKDCKSPMVIWGLVCWSWSSPTKSQRKSALSLGVLVLALWCLASLPLHTGSVLCTWPGCTAEIKLVLRGKFRCRRSPSNTATLTSPTITFCL